MPDPTKPQPIDYDTFEQKLSDNLKIPRGLLRGMTSVESGGNPDAVSPVGAQGRFQVMPATFEGSRRKWKMDHLDPKNPLDNAYVGARYLRELYDEAPKDLPDDRAKWGYAVSRYHGGGMDKQGNVRAISDGAVTTDKHVEKVMKRWADVENQNPDPRWNREAKVYDWSQPSLDWKAINNPQPAAPQQPQAPRPQQTIPAAKPQRTVNIQSQPSQPVPASRLGFADKPAFQKIAEQAIASTPSEVTARQPDGSVAKPTTPKQPPSLLERATRTAVNLTPGVGALASALGYDPGATVVEGAKEVGRQAEEFSELPGDWSNIGNEAAKGFRKAVRSAPQAAATLLDIPIRTATRMLPDDPYGAKKTIEANLPLAEKLDPWTRQQMAETDRIYQEKYGIDPNAKTKSSVIGGSFGQSIPLLAGGAVGLGAKGVAAIGAGMNAQQAYREAGDKGATPEEKSRAATFAAPIGALEGLFGAEAQLAKAGVSRVMARKAAEVLKNAPAEVGQEVLTEALNNINKAHLSGYAPDTKLLDGMVEAAIGSLGMTGAIGGTGLVARGVNRVANAREAFAPPMQPAATEAYNETFDSAEAQRRQRAAQSAVEQDTRNTVDRIFEQVMAEPAAAVAKQQEAAQTTAAQNVAQAAAEQAAPTELDKLGAMFGQKTPALKVTEKAAKTRNDLAEAQSLGDADVIEHAQKIHLRALNALAETVSIAERKPILDEIEQIKTNTKPSTTKTPAATAASSPQPPTPNAQPSPAQSRKPITQPVSNSTPVEETAPLTPLERQHFHLLGRMTEAEIDAIPPQVARKLLPQQEPIAAPKPETSEEIAYARRLQGLDRKVSPGQSSVTPEQYDAQLAKLDARKPALKPEPIAQSPEEIAYTKQTDALTGKAPDAKFNVTPEQYRSQLSKLEASDKPLTAREQEDLYALQLRDAERPAVPEPLPKRYVARGGRTAPPNAVELGNANTRNITQSPNRQTNERARNQSVVAMGEVQQSAQPAPVRPIASDAQSGVFRSPTPSVPPQEQVDHEISRPNIPNRAGASQNPPQTESGQSPLAGSLSGKDQSPAPGRTGRSGALASDTSQVNAPTRTSRSNPAPSGSATPRVQETAQLTELKAKEARLLEEKQNYETVYSGKLVGRKPNRRAMAGLADIERRIAANRTAQQQYIAAAKAARVESENGQQLNTQRPDTRQSGTDASGQAGESSEANGRDSAGDGEASTGATVDRVSTPDADTRLPAANPRAVDEAQLSEIDLVKRRYYQEQMAKRAARRENAKKAVGKKPKDALGDHGKIESLMHKGIADAKGNLREAVIKHPDWLDLLNVTPDADAQAIFDAIAQDYHDKDAASQITPLEWKGTADALREQGHTDLADSIDATLGATDEFKARVDKFVGNAGAEEAIRQIETLPPNSQAAKNARAALLQYLKDDEVKINDTGGNPAQTNLTDSWIKNYVAGRFAERKAQGTRNESTAPSQQRASRRANSETASTEPNQATQSESNRTGDTQRAGQSADVARAESNEQQRINNETTDRSPSAISGQPATVGDLLYSGTTAERGILKPRGIAKTYNQLGSWFTSSKSAADELYSKQGERTLEIRSYQKPEGNLLEAPHEDFYKLFGSNIPLLEKHLGKRAADTIKKQLPNTPRLRELEQKVESNQRITDKEVTEVRSLRASHDIARKAMNDSAYMQAFQTLLKDAGYSGIVWRKSTIDSPKTVASHDVYLIFHDQDISPVAQPLTTSDLRTAPTLENEQAKRENAPLVKPETPLPKSTTQQDRSVSELLAIKESGRKITLTDKERAAVEKRIAMMQREIAGAKESRARLLRRDLNALESLLPKDSGFTTSALGVGAFAKFNDSDIPTLARHFVAHSKSFGSWARAVLKDLGARVRPHLQGAWKALQTFAKDQRGVLNEQAVIEGIKNLAKKAGFESNAEYGARKRAEMENSPEFKRWFGDSKVMDEKGKPLVVYHATSKKFDAFKPSNYRGGASFFSTVPDRAIEAAQASARELVGSDPSQILPTYLSAQNLYGQSYVLPNGVPDITGIRVTEKTVNALERKVQEAIDAAVFSENERVNSYAKKIAKDEWLRFHRFEENDDGSGQFVRNDHAMEYRSGKLVKSEPDPMAWEIFERGPSYSDHGGIGAKAVQSLGYDSALIADEGAVKGAKTIAVFSPTQIKSAFNRGTFDPTDANISHDIVSATGKAIGATVKALRKPKAPAAPDALIPLPPDFTLEKYGKELYGTMKALAKKGKLDPNGDTVKKVTEAGQKLIDAINAGDGAEVAKQRQHINRLLISRTGALLSDGLRPLMLAGDLLIGRQGFFGWITHPKISAQVLNATKGALSPTAKGDKVFYNEFAKMMTDPHLSLAKQVVDFGVLHEVEVGKRLLRSEEGAFASGWANLPVIRQIEHFNKLYMDMYRLKVFSTEMDRRVKAGIKIADKKGKPTPDTLAYGKRVNIVSGRGELGTGKLHDAVEASSAFALLAPRWWISRLQVINQTANPISWAMQVKRANSGLTPETSKQIGKESAIILGAQAGLIGLGIAAAALGLIDSFNWQDPEEPEWMMAKKGNRRFSLMQGGIRPHAQFAGRLMKQMWKMAVTAATEGRFDVTAKEKIVENTQRYGRTKLGTAIGGVLDQTLFRAPVNEHGAVPPAMLKYMDEEEIAKLPTRGIDPGGNPNTVAESIFGRVFPLTYKNMFMGAWEEMGKQQGAGNKALGFLGGGLAHTPELAGLDMNEYPNRQAKVEGQVFARRKYQLGYGDFRDYLADKGYESESDFQKTVEARKPIVDSIVKGLGDAKGLAREELLKAGLRKDAIERAEKLPLKDVEQETANERQRAEDWAAIERDPRYLALSKDGRTTVKRRFTAQYTKYQSEITKNGTVTAHAVPIPAPARVKPDRKSLWEK